MLWTLHNVCLSDSPAVSEYIRVYIISFLDMRNSKTLPYVGLEKSRYFENHKYLDERCQEKNLFFFHQWFHHNVHPQCSLYASASLVMHWVHYPVPVPLCWFSHVIYFAGWDWKWLNCGVKYTSSCKITHCPSFFPLRKKLACRARISSAFRDSS